MRQTSSPSVIVIGGGVAGVAAARALHDASFQVLPNEYTVVGSDPLCFGLFV